MNTCYYNLIDSCVSLNSTDSYYSGPPQESFCDYIELITFNTFKHENIIELPLFKCWYISPALKNIGSFPVNILFPPTMKPICEIPISKILNIFTFSSEDHTSVRRKTKEDVLYIEGYGFIFDYKYNPYVIVTADVKLLDEKPSFIKFNIKVDTSIMEKANFLQRVIYNRIIKPFYKITATPVPIELTFCDLHSYITIHRANPEKFRNSIDTIMHDHLNNPTVVESMCDLL